MTCEVMAVLTSHVMMGSMNVDTTHAESSLTEASVTAAFLRGPHDRIDVGRGSLAHWRFGTGPDVVLVHGWPLHGATWRRVVPALAKRFTLHVIDLPHVGFSTDFPDDVPSDLESHAAAVRRAVDVLGLRDFAYLAHDSGGGIARFAAAGDARVRGLVLANTEIPGHRPWQVRVYCRLTRLGLGSVISAALRVRVLRHGPLGFGGCFTDPSYADGEFGDIFVKPLLASRRARQGQLALARDLDFDTLDRLEDVHARIAAPVLLVWGPEDPFFPVAKARAMAKQFAGDAELVEIPGGKLFAHEDHPEKLVAHAAPFLQRCLVA